MARRQERDEAHATTAPAWRQERAELMETIRRQQEDAERLAARFKLLQRTLVDQQKLLDRYQQALVASGALTLPSGDSSSSSEASTAASASGADPSSAASAGASAPAASAVAAATNAKKQPPADKHRAVTAANTARNATSSTTPAVPRQVTQETEDAAAAATTSASPKHASRSSSSKKRLAVTPDPHRADAESKPVVAPIASTSITPLDGGAKPRDVSSKGESTSWISRKADFHRASAASEQPSTASEAKPEPSPPVSSSSATATALPKAIAGGVKRKARTSTTWAEEKLRMQEAGIATTSKRRFTDLKPTVSAPKAAPARRSKGEESPQSSADEKENAFQFVEVVRNRDARAALPGHDCAECRKYYEALNGLIPDAEAQLAKSKCSRHRARFEPYNTPDDFWRLSFPDSESQPLSP